MQFQMLGPATEKARVLTVDNLTDGMWRRLVPAERIAQRRRWVVQANMAPIHLEPCKPGPLFYTQRIPGHRASAMQPESWKCNRNSEGDGSVVLTHSGEPESTNQVGWKANQKSIAVLPKSSLLSTRLTTSVCRVDEGIEWLIKATLRQFRMSPTNHCQSQKTRVIALSCGIITLAVCCFVS